MLKNEIHFVSIKDPILIGKKRFFNVFRKLHVVHRKDEFIMFCLHKHRLMVDDSFVCSSYSHKMFERFDSFYIDSNRGTQ